jgi:hypothetical protein
MINLDHATQILALLQQENIRTVENTSGDESRIVNRKIVAFRALLEKEDVRNFAPALTRSATLTMLKVAACHEMLQRFALEYFLRFKKADIAMVFATNEQNKDENHCFALVGKEVIDCGLMLSRGKIQEKEKHIPIQEFLNRQKTDTVLVDPFLNCADAVNGSCKDVLDYCTRHDITHIMGVAQFLPSIVGIAAEVKEEATRLADKVTRDFDRCIMEAAQADLVYSSRLIAVLQKFKLNPQDIDNVAIREQAFRRAAMSGTTEDLTVLVESRIDINAQDNNPSKKYTALHLAVMNKQLDNAIFLLKFGARFDIPNANGMTASDLIEGFEPGSDREKLKSLLIPS